MPDDPIAAIRRLADLARAHGDRDGYPHIRDLVAILPVLDAVAAGQADEGRVERWALAIAGCGGSTAANGQVFVDVQEAARAAMALADAERAAAVAAGWKAYEEARDTLEMAAGKAADGGDACMDRWDDARTALDAAVRRLAGVAGL